MKHYDFLAPAKICFGWGRRSEAGRLAATLGRRVYIVWGSRTLRAGEPARQLLASLAEADVQVEEVGTISHEPTVEDVDTAAWTVRELGVTDDSFVLAVGGGAAIDLAKAVAAMAPQSPDARVVDYLEGVGRGLTLTAAPLPVMAMPTTAGTGSEATKNAVISSYDPPFKKSLRSEKLIPRVVLVDPELTVSCPIEVTAHSGMDALTQCIESYISAKATPVASALAAEGLRVGLPALAGVCADGTDRAGREAMAHAALLSGMALANSGLGMAHGVAAALGVLHNVPHGLACAVMLPIALRTNLQACAARYAELERLFDPNARGSDAAHAFVHRVESLCRQVGIPTQLSALQVTAEALPALVEASHGNSLQGNPRNLTDPELMQILEAAL